MTYTSGDIITVYPLKRVAVEVVTDDGRVYAGGKWYTTEELEEYHEFIVEQFMKERGK